jgi:CrcB protein
LSINVAGSLLLGFLLIFLPDRLPHRRLVRPAVCTGTIGAFTTFSTFSVETVNLIRVGSWGTASAYVLLSVAICLGGTIAGIAVARKVVHRGAPLPARIGS